MLIRATLNGCIRCLWACDSIVLICMSDAPDSIIALGQARFDVRNWGAGSTGRRNTGVKSLCRGFKLQGLTWSFVELTSHFVQISLRVHRQVGALWKVLSQQAIGVLVRPALPRALRITKIDVDAGRQRKATM